MIRSLSLSHLIFLLFLYLEFTVAAFYKLGTFIFRSNWLENTVLCNRKRCFRNVNQRKRKSEWFSRCLSSFFSFFFCKLFSWFYSEYKFNHLEIKITSFIVLSHTATTYCPFSWKDLCLERIQGTLSPMSNCLARWCLW